MKKTWLSVLLLVGFLVPTQAASYKVDPDHSTVMFKIRHLLGKVSGDFEKFSGTYEYDPKNPKTFKALAEIEAESINTNVAKRDEHLRSADFFDTKTYPKIAFVSKGVTDLKDNKGKIKGDLTMHGVTKPIVLDIEFLGAAKDPWGNERSAISAMGVIKRAEWGLTWNSAVETGGLLVGEEVELILEIEGIKQ